uniref:Uncharacterized protein n=1 Tax=Anguilla anguilla TaxID=7936 RepID=A0A0E9TDS4_ANGAN
MALVSTANVKVYRNTTS